MNLKEICGIIKGYKKIMMWEEYYGKVYCM